MWKKKEAILGLRSDHRLPFLTSNSDRLADFWDANYGSLDFDINFNADIDVEVDLGFRRIISQLH